MPTPLIHLLCVAALWAVPMTAGAQQAPAAPAAPTSASSDLLKQAFPNARVQRNLDGSPGLVVGLNVQIQGKTLEDKVKAFVTSWGQALGLEHVSLQVVGTPQKMGATHVVRLSQMHGPMAVFQRMATVTFNAKGHIIAWHANTLPVRQTTKGPVTDQQAIAHAAASLYGPKADSKVKGARVLARVLWADPTQAVEAWLVQLPRTSTLLAPRVLVRTTDGAILSTHDAAKR